MTNDKQKAPIETSCENCMYFDYPDDTGEEYDGDDEEPDDGADDA